MARVAVGARRLATGIRETADMVMLKHTVFALPFAVISLITAGGRGWGDPETWLWVVVAMVAARTAAMAFNRLADHPVDALNPRTAGRALPAGRLSRGFAWTVTAVSAAVFVVAAGQLNELCLALSAPALAVLLGYSLSKRFTMLSHLWLGAALGLAPVGAWLAVTPRLATEPVVLGGAVLCWVAGFDIVYSLQDETFDRRHGLHSMPARLGGDIALWVARGLHVAAFVGFAAFAVLAGGGALRLGAVAAAGGLLAWQHRLVSPGRLEAVDAAFFTANGVLSVVMCILFVLAKARVLG